MLPQYWLHPQCWEHPLVMEAFSGAGYILSAGCTPYAVSILSAESITQCWMYSQYWVHPLVLGASPGAGCYPLVLDVSLMLCSCPVTPLLYALRLQHAVWLRGPGAARPAWLLLGTR